MSKHIDEQKNKELEKLKVQVEEYLNGWKRALADYENLKKQTQKEKEEFAKFATLNFVISLIPVYDHLKLSFNHLPEEFPPAELPASEIAPGHNSLLTSGVNLTSETLAPAPVIGFCP